MSTYVPGSEGSEEKREHFYISLSEFIETSGCQYNVVVLGGQNVRVGYYVVGRYSAHVEMIRRELDMFVHGAGAGPGNRVQIGKEDPRGSGEKSAG